jgi:hypothetical protein
VSGNVQSLPGIPIVASYVATNAQILPSLGRSLSGGNTTATVANVIAPGALYESRITQLDFRLTKIVRLGRTRIQGMFDLYNVLNGSAILSENSRYGSAWLTPMQILDVAWSRLARAWGSERRRCECCSSYFVPRPWSCGTSTVTVCVVVPPEFVQVIVIA